MTHTDVKEIADKAILTVPVEPGDRGEARRHGLRSRRRIARAFVVAHNGSTNLITLRYRLKD